MPTTRDMELGEKSTLTQRYQTTIPRGVRNILNLKAGDRIEYSIHGGEVVLKRVPDNATDGEDDPVVSAFLDFIARDLEVHPEHIRALPADLVQRAAVLTEGVDIDLDAELDPEND